MFGRLAWRNIWRNKRRTWITIASILFSVLFAVFMRSMQLGMYDLMIDNVVRSYSGYIQVHKKGYWDEKTLNNSMAKEDSLIDKVASVDGVELVAPRLEGFALASYKDLTKGVMVVGVEPDKERKLMGLDSALSKGRMINDSSRGVLVGKGIGEFFGLGVGDTLVFLGQGYHGMSAAGKYPIIGLVELSSPELNKQMVFLPLKEAQWFYGTGGRLTALSLTIEENRDVEGLSKQVRTRVDTSRYEVMDWKSMMPELVQTIQADNAGGVIMVFILYMVIAFGIFGTILMMTAERMKEFGILISIGMKRWKLSIVIFLESLLLGLVGVVLGMGFTFPFLLYFHEHPIQLTGSAAKAMEDFGFEAVLPASTDPDILLTHALVVLGLSVLAALYPLTRILGLKPIEAMRS